MQPRLTSNAKAVAILCAIIISLSLQGFAKTTITVSMWAQEQYWLPMFDRFESEHPDIQFEFFHFPITSRQAGHTECTRVSYTLGLQA